MANHPTAVSRRLTDPDFQARLVSRSLLLSTVMTVLLGVSLAHDAWVWLYPPPPKYFFVDGRTPPRPAVALDSPIVDDAQLLEWTSRAVQAPYNVNYHDYPEQLNTAGRRFTSEGWASFAGTYIRSGNYAQMKTARLLCYAQAQRAAIIRQTKMLSGRLAYEIQLPIVQTCQNSQQESTQRVMLTALVVRTDAQDHPDGLAVHQLVAAEQ
jgi:intracellular multiplication protein IcmL